MDPHASILGALTRTGVEVLSNCRCGECFLCAMTVFDTKGEIDTSRRVPQLCPASNQRQLVRLSLSYPWRQLSAGSACGDPKRTQIDVLMPSPPT